MNKVQQEVLAEVPEMYQGVTQRAFAGTGSPRAAIKAKCLECVGYVRADVSACVAVRCPLHAYRPYRSAK
jgi:hypothetical protein